MGSVPAALTEPEVGNRLADSYSRERVVSVKTAGMEGREERSEVTEEIPDRRHVVGTGHGSDGYRPSCQNSFDPVVPERRFFHNETDGLDGLGKTETGIGTASGFMRLRGGGNNRVLRRKGGRRLATAADETVLAKGCRIQGNGSRFSMVMPDGIGPGLTIRPYRRASCREGFRADPFFRKHCNGGRYDGRAGCRSGLFWHRVLPPCPVAFQGE